MLSSLASKLTGSNPDKLAETIQRLTAERDAAKIRQDVASQAWGDALALQAEGDGDTPDTVKLEREMDAASQAFRAKDAALTAAKARHGAAVVQASRDSMSEQWGKAEALAGARSASAVRLAQSIRDFAACHEDFLKVNAALTGALPEAPDPDAAFLRGAQVENAIRAEMQRLGVDWAFHWPWGTVSIPSFTPQFEATPDLIRHWRDSAMARATGQKA
jgi:hypothetical protein